MSNASLPKEHVLLAIKHHPELQKSVGHSNTMIDAFRKAVRESKGKHIS